MTVEELQAKLAELSTQRQTLPNLQSLLQFYAQGGEMTLERLRVARDELLQRLASGVKSTTFGDREVVYRDHDDVRIALDLIDREIAKAQAPQQSRQFTIQTNRGL